MTWLTAAVRAGEPTRQSMPDRFDLVISKKTADFMGLTIPQSILAQATEIID